MKTLHITDEQTGTVYPGHLPEGWHEVPVSAFQRFATLQAGRRPELAMLSAVQALTALPSDVLEADLSLAAGLAQQLPWFFTGLPAGEPAEQIHHRGVIYEHQGDFSRLNAGQYEALLAFLDEAGGNPALATPHLLAVLYVRQGGKQDTRSVAAAAEAFASLPIATAWPPILNFCKLWSGPALRIQSYTAAKLQVETALAQMETALTSAPKPAGGLRGLYSTTAVALAKRYVRSVRGRLRNC